MAEDYELGCIINPSIEIEDERHDPPIAVFRGTFIEAEAGKPFASEEARARAGAQQGFRFDTRLVDFADLLDVFGVCSLGSIEHEETEAIRARPPMGIATPILGFRNPRTARVWRPMPENTDLLRITTQLTEQLSILLTALAFGHRQNSSVVGRSIGRVVLGAKTLESAFVKINNPVAR